MKKIIIIALTGILTISLIGVVIASNDHKDGYRSKLYGTIEELPADRNGIWIVDGRQVLVTEGTRIEEEYGRTEVGSFVEIKGSTDGQIFNASKLEVKRSSKEDREHTKRTDHKRGELYGTVQSIPQERVGIWMIDNEKVLVDERTWFDREHGEIVVGSFVEVKGDYKNHSFHARKIEKK